MLTDILPKHQFHVQEETVKHPCKKVILVNKATNNYHYCDSMRLNVDDNDRFCFSDLINDLKPKYPQLTRAFFFLYINGQEYLVGADPYNTPRHIDYKLLKETDIIILYNEQKNHKKKELSGVNNWNQNLIISDTQNSNQTDIPMSAASRKVSDQISFIKQEDETEFLNSENKDDEMIDEGIKKLVKPREKRVKERTIEYVMEKVKKWRDIYENGIKNELGEDVKPNLDVAACQVQLSRKTLDDYYAQLRKGEMYGFNFSENMDQKMGVLRKFVKAQEKQNPNKKNKGKLLEIESTLFKKEPFNKPNEQQQNQVFDHQLVKVEFQESNEMEMEQPMDIEVESQQQQQIQYKRPRFQNFEYKQYENIMQTNNTQAQADIDEYLAF